MKLTALLAPACILIAAAASIESTASASVPSPIVNGAADAGTPWAMDLEMSPPSAVPVGGGATPARVVWYVAFKVTNKTGAARSLSPFARLKTETGKEYAASYDPEALKALRSTVGADLVDIYELSSAIEDGASKQMVATFGSIDPNANYLSLQLQGFAAALVRRGGEWVQAAREYQATFHRPGDSSTVLRTIITCTKEAWVTVDTRKIRGDKAK